MVLRFTPKISRYANLYFFIQNLSEWHFSNRKKHNEEWQNELTFSNEANSCIQQFKIIHQKYPFGDKYLGRPFFLYNNPWPEVKKIIENDDLIKIRNIFTIIEPYFNQIYIKDEKRLLKWASIISNQEFIKKSSLLNNTLACFYGCSPFNDKCLVYLMLSTKEKNGGTANSINNHSITLELSRTSINSKNKKLAQNILWHELIHLYFRNFTLYPLLEKRTNNDLELMGKIDELLASALLPMGLLSKDTLTTIIHSKTPKNLNTRIKDYKIIEVQKLLLPYLKEEKKIDIDLIGNIYTMI